jgi:hypothetical protein
MSNFKNTIKWLRRKPDHNAKTWLFPNICCVHFFGLKNKFIIICLICINDFMSTLCNFKAINQRYSYSKNSALLKQFKLLFFNFYYAILNCQDNDRLDCLNQKTKLIKPKYCSLSRLPFSNRKLALQS